MVKKTRGTAGASRAYLNRRSGKDKYSGSQKSLVRSRKRRRNEERYIYNGCG